MFSKLYEFSLGLHDYLPKRNFEHAWGCVSARTRGRGWASMYIFRIRGSIFRDFLRTSFMEVLN